MGNEEKDWQERVEHQRLSDKLEDIQDRVRELEITIHGKRAKTGLVGEFTRHDEKLTKLYAVIFQDPTGQKGLLRDVDYLMGRAKSHESITPYRWQFWGLIITSIITAATTITLNWEKIKTHLPKYQPTALEKKIERAKHPKGKKIVRVRVIKPAPEPIKESPQSP